MGQVVGNVCTVLVLALGVFGALAVGQTHHVSPALERLRALEGRWEGTTDRGDPEAVVTYEIVGRGSAVVETLFPDTPRAMTTVYHDDPDGNLVMTHYCTGGNQPFLALVAADEDHLRFELSPDDRTIDVAHEGHAHELTMTLGADGTLEHDWLNWAMGAPAASRNIRLERVE
jgi:hypothetical protein